MMAPRSPAHLCLVNSMRPWGGAEVWFLETARQLQERGHRISLACQPGTALEERTRMAGVAVVPIPIRFDTAPWTLAKLHHHFRRTGVTAILANLTKDLKAAALAGRLAGVEIILGTRESDFPLKDKAYYRWYFRKLATGLLVASQATRRTVLESVPWLEESRVHLVHKGIDTVRFCPPAAPPAGRPATVGFLGQLIARKGLPQLMAAWSRIENREGNAVLAIAGEGALRTDLEQWRRGLAHPDRVLLKGYIEDPAAFLQGIDILAMPSLSEGFGLAAAEAGACGLPVIAGNASSLPEIVVHRETGWLVQPGDADDLFGALRMLLDKPALARKLGTAARQRVAHLFDREKTLDQLEILCGLRPSAEGRDR